MTAQRILVVDDDEATCQFMEMMLKSEGYETESVHTAKEAIGLVRQTRFNLVILGNKLPDGEGIGLLTHLHEIEPDMDIIIITGYASQELTKRALDSGAVSCIVKPLDLRDILPKVADVLNNQRLVKKEKQIE